MFEVVVAQKYNRQRDHGYNVLTTCELMQFIIIGSWLQVDVHGHCMSNLAAKI